MPHCSTGEWSGIPYLLCDHGRPAECSSSGDGFPAGTSRHSKRNPGDQSAHGIYPSGTLNLRDSRVLMRLLQVVSILLHHNCNHKNHLRRNRCRNHHKNRHRNHHNTSHHRNRILHHSWNRRKKSSEESSLSSSEESELSEDDVASPVIMAVRSWILLRIRVASSPSAGVG